VAKILHPEDLPLVLLIWAGTVALIAIVVAVTLIRRCSCRRCARNHGRPYQKMSPAEAGLEGIS
jgi:hypothetical protein